MHILIKSQKRYLSSFSSWNLIFLDSSWNSSSCNLQIPAIYCCSRYIEDEYESWGHWRSVHIVLWGQKVYWSILEFFPLVNIVPHSLQSKRGVIIVVNIVWALAKVANPSCSTICESNKWIDIGSAIFASDYWILTKWNRRYWLIILKD